VPLTDRFPVRPALLACVALLALAVAAGAAAPASAPASAGGAAHAHGHGGHGGDGDAHVPRPGHPGDSDAPSNAPPHWIPWEPWVLYHWLPYDERRLQALLRADRRELWAWLRDDRRTLGALARRRGHRSLRRLARRLVAPRLAGVPAARRRALVSRALRTLTQGHLAQHILFHSLHQEAGPEAAARIFGVRDSEAFRALRRLDLSPLRIGRMHGRTRAQMQRGLVAALRARMAEGVRGGHISRGQGALFLERQLRQVPRWLGEDHYNGPPQTNSRGRPIHPFRPSFSSPALAGDGGTVLFDAIQPAPPLAVRFGEVNLEGRDLRDGARLVPRDASASALAARPCSSFNPAVSGDGQVAAFELSAGNRTFAKRYGDVRVVVADLAARRLRVLGGHGEHAGHTAYAPDVSQDGSTVAYQGVMGDGMSARRSPTRVHVTDLRTGATRTVGRGDAFEPSLSGDGRRVAYTAFARGRLQVFVDGVQVTRATGEAWGPALSADGRTLAYAASEAGVPGARVHVLDLASGRSRAISPAGRVVAADPAVSADGGVVAFSLVAPGERRRSSSGRPLQQVHVHDARTGATTLASAGSDGAAGDGWSGQPALSADGSRIAFSTDAASLGAGGRGPGGLRIALHDRGAGTTSAVSERVPVSAFRTGLSLAPAGDGPLCAMAPPVW
jgi:hypothetical protein